MSKIMVVDDEAIISMQLEERLSGMGYTVCGMAASGEESIKKARSLRPDIVLMDIVMPGKINGIEAAGQISYELNIPVVFVTSYADDAIIERAKQVRPYGYIIKPFNELEIKASVEVALFRKKTEEEQERKIKKNRSSNYSHLHDGEVFSDATIYHDLPEMKTILLKDIFNEIVLYLYTIQAMKEPLFKYILEEGIKKGGLNVFSYTRSTLQKFFLKEIQSRNLITHRIKKEEDYSLLHLLEKMTMQKNPDPTDPLRVLVDFSENQDISDIHEITAYLIGMKNSGIPVSGMIAVNIDRMNHTDIESLATGISRIIVSTGKDTTLSFAHHSFPSGAISIVPQDTIDEVVKKSLEPVVLTFLNKPLSGYDIIHEIHAKYNVLIPQARVYALLHDYLEKGYLEIKMSGKSKLYSPTQKGNIYFKQKLNDFKQVFQHILGYGGEKEENAQKLKKA